MLPPGDRECQEQKEKSLELRGATSLSRLWADCGKRAEAPSLLEPVYHWFTEGLETPDLPEARALIAKFALQSLNTIMVSDK